MIKVISTTKTGRTPVAGGHVRNVLGAAEEGTRVRVSIQELEAGQAAHFAAGDRTQVVYVLEGQDAHAAYTAGGRSEEHALPRRAGVYLEPGEEATITACATTGSVQGHAACATRKAKRDDTVVA